jgi:hypothetical protein
MSKIDKEIASWNVERDRILRSLNINQFQAFWEKHNLPTPRGGWASPMVPLIMMHKSRLQVTTMTESEREVSRSWLLSHGYDLGLE